MSNYYISDCCKSQITEIFNEYEGMCSKCNKPCELEVITDEDMADTDYEFNYN